MTKFDFSRVMRALSVAGLALFLLSGCKKSSEEEKDDITLTPMSLNFKADAGRSSVNVKSSSDWNTVTEADWLTITKASSGRAFSVEVQKNMNEELRTATVAVTNLSGQQATLTVRQTGINPALEVDKKNIAIGAAGGNDVVSVVSNIEWTVQQQSDWLDVEVDGDNITVCAPENPLFEERVDTLVIMPVSEQYADKAVKIAVKQAAQVYAVSVTGEDLDEKGSLICESEQGVFVLSVVANSDWTAASTAEWIVCKPAQGGKTDAAGESVAVEIAGNEEAAQRNAEIVFVCGDAEYKVAVTQRSAGVYLEMENGGMQFTDESASMTRNIVTNGQVSFSSTGSWVSAAYADGVIEVKVEANAGAKRTATLTVTSSAGEQSMSENIEIMQMGYAVNLSENGTANCYVVNGAGTYKIKATVKGNGAHTIGLDRVAKTIEPNGAMIVWTTDTTGCIDNVTLFDDYLYFETNGANGNAVIAATNDEYSLNPDEEPYRTILWSWHIWMTDFDLNDPMNHYEIGGDALGLHSTMMGRNLGALSSGESGRDDDLLGSFGLQYQWGRKDPFPGAIAITFDPKNEDMNTNGSGLRSENAEIFYYRTDTGKPKSTKEFMWLYNYQVAEESVEKNVQWAVENPEYFIKSANTAYLWVTSTPREDGKTLNPLDESNPWGYLWGNPNTTANSIADKSIYDPCPAGWQVPSAGQWYFITAHGSDMIWVYGYNSRWKYNHVEGRTATIKDISAGAREHSNDWNYLWNNTVIRMKDMKGGFNLYYTTRNEGVIPEGGDRFDVMETTHEADGPTMFLPAAGVRNYFGELRRVGFGCHYWCSGIRSTDLKKNERLQANAVNIDYQGNLIASFASDYNQQVCSRSVRCVKTEL